MAVATLAIFAFAAPAQAQKQEYAPWVFEQMVPTGPHMRNMEQAQPIPGPRPSHWGSMGSGEQHRAGMRQYGTDAVRATPSYSRTHSLTPPVRDARAAGPGPELTVSTPRQVQIHQE